MMDELNFQGCHFVQTQAQADCSGCQQCAAICPDAAIEIEEEND